MDYFFDNIHEMVLWSNAEENQATVLKIIENMNQYASRIVTVGGMLDYAEALMKKLVAEVRFVGEVDTDTFSLRSSCKTQTAHEYLQMTEAMENTP